MTLVLGTRMATLREVQTIYDSEDLANMAEAATVMRANS